MRTHSVDWYHHIPPHVKEIIAVLEGAGFQAFLVGGSVRDLWLGLKPKDFDLVTNATPDEVEKLFPRTEGVGRQFGIMIVVTEGGPVEVARFRADAEYEDGRHPTGVVFSSPEEDAKRRDFTVNALFYDAQKREVIDYVGGLDDLQKKCLRCVGDPFQRFEEDSLRMLRAARFHSQLAEAGFTLDADLIDAVRARRDRLSLVSRERVTQEVGKIFLSPRPSVGLFDLVLMGLWEPVFGLYPPNASLYANFDVLTGGSLPLFLCAFAHWVPDWRPETFVLTKETKAALAAMPDLFKQLRHYAALERAWKKRLLHAPFVHEAIEILRVEADDDLLNLLDDAEEDRARWEKAGLLDPPPLLKGADLLALGMKPGPAVKEALEKVRLAQLNEEITTKEEALKRVKIS